MSEKQREALARILAVLPYIPPSKLEYLQGYAEAMEDMNRQQAATQEPKPAAEEVTVV